MISAESAVLPPSHCSGCNGAKKQPIAAQVRVGDPGHLLETSSVITLVLCEECGRDLANAVGFMCIREGGWSKLEPRKRKEKR